MQAKNDFYVFKKWLGENQMKNNILWHMKSWNWNFSVHKVLLAHSHTHAFTYCLWLLCLQTVEVEELQQKSYGLKNLTPHDLGLYRNSLPPPVVKGSAVMPPSLSWILSSGNPVVSSCQLVIPPGARGTRRRRQEESCLSRAGLLSSPLPHQRSNQGPPLRHN